MLGSSSSIFDNCIKALVHISVAKSILELGCGQGKFGKLMQSEANPLSLCAVQKIFSPSDVPSLYSLGYEKIIDADILDFFRAGFDETYDLVIALDVIEHFLYSDVISIINFALYRSDYMLLVWPSAHPQSATHSEFDRHRASFELRDLTDRFNVVFYTQTGFAQINCAHRYHMVMLRGHMNLKVLPPLFG